MFFVSPQNENWDEGELKGEGETEREREREKAKASKKRNRKKERTENLQTDKRWKMLPFILRNYTPLCSVITIYYVPFHPLIKEKSFLLFWRSEHTKSGRRESTKHTDRRQAIQFPTAGLIFINNSIVTFLLYSLRCHGLNFACHYVAGRFIIHKKLKTMKLGFRSSLAFNVSRGRMNEMKFFLFFDASSQQAASLPAQQPEEKNHEKLGG